MTEAYPALFVVPRPVEDGEDGVMRTPEPPTADEVTDVVNEALESAGWTPHDTVLDARRGARQLQEEVPPADPIEVEGVTVVFAQSPAPEAQGHYSGPFEVSKQALGKKYSAEVWIDAVEL